MINLYLIPTPIGNMEDITLRALDLLKTVDVIYCEDTRNTKKLLLYHGINRTLKSNHIFNEDKKADEILRDLKEGKVVAICSDAGYPGISDPGYLACKRAIEEGFTVSTIPGATASLTALTTSGIPCDKFFFYGFLAHTTQDKLKELQSFIDYEYTIIFYESPHRIAETIQMMGELYQDRELVIARELTKKHEEYIRGTCASLSNANLDIKGEIVLILAGAKKDSLAVELSNLSIKEHYEYYLKETNDSKEAMKKVAKDRGISKSIVYNELLKK